jgi:hypothetical protein
VWGFGAARAPPARPPVATRRHEYAPEPDYRHMRGNTMIPVHHTIHHPPGGHVVRRGASCVGAAREPPARLPPSRRAPTIGVGGADVCNGIPDNFYTDTPDSFLRRHPQSMIYDVAGFSLSDDQLAGLLAI